VVAQHAGQVRTPAGGSRPPSSDRLPRTPPPRPQLQRDAPPPVLGRRRVARPTAVRTGAALWGASCAAAVGGLLAVAADGQGLRDRLTAAASAADPSASADLLRSGVRTAVLLVTGAEAVLTLVVLVCAVLLLRRSRIARWVLAVAGVLGVVVAVVAQRFVAGGQDVDRWAFVAQAAALLLALGTMGTRSTRAWLRGPG
jgi:hypothetical protein